MGFVDVFDGTQMTRTDTEEHRFLFFFYADTAQPKFNLCKPVCFCVICVLFIYTYINYLFCLEILFLEELFQVGHHGLMLHGLDFVLQFAS